MEIIETASIINTLEMTDMDGFDEITFSRIVNSIDVDEDSINYNLRNELVVKIERMKVNKNVS